MTNVKRALSNIISIFAVLLIVAAVYASYNVNITRLNNVVIHSSKLDNGEKIKVLQITDVHNKKSVGNNLQIIKLLKKSKPDIVVITGDLVDIGTKRYNSVYSLIKQMAKINPRLYFVTGDDELQSGNAEEFLKGLRERKVTVLDYQSVLINIKGTIIDLRGVPDSTFSSLDMDKATKDMTDNLYTIMLSHRPEVIYNYKDKVPDLTLSGHTHGGQIRLPLIGAVVAQGQGFLPKLDKGIFNISENRLLYVDSGVGTSTMPLRFLNQSDVTLITIEGISDDEQEIEVEKE